MSWLYKISVSNRYLRAFGTKPFVVFHSCLLYNLIDHFWIMLWTVPVNSNLKSRLHARFSYICCIFSHKASASGYCLQELKHNSKVVYLVTIILFDPELWLDTVHVRVVTDQEMYSLKFCVSSLLLSQIWMFSEGKSKKLPGLAGVLKLQVDVDSVSLSLIFELSVILTLTQTPKINFNTNHLNNHN